MAAELINALVVSTEERFSYKEEVVGSTPTWGTVTVADWCTIKLENEQTSPPWQTGNATGCDPVLCEFESRRRDLGRAGAYGAVATRSFN